MNRNEQQGIGMTSVKQKLTQIISIGCVFNLSIIKWVEIRCAQAKLSIMNISNFYISNCNISEFLIECVASFVAVV